MTMWRASGSIMAVRRSSIGLHLVLHCRRLRSSDRNWRDLPFVPALCRADALSLLLERHLRIGDNVSLRGHVERNTRRQIPMLKRDWDLVVTRAHVPRFQNWLRRRFVRSDIADD